MIRNRKEYKINTLDINKNRGIGISIPFDPVSIFNITYSTKDQIKSNLINFLLTNKGERVFNVDFGDKLRYIVFDQMNNLEETRQSLSDKIRIYFPTITINSLTIDPDYNNNVISIKLNYTVNTQQDSLSIQLV